MAKTYWERNLHTLLVRMETVAATREGRQHEGFSKGLKLRLGVQVQASNPYTSETEAGSLQGVKVSLVFLAGQPELSQK